MVIQYPYIARIYKPGDSERDVNGNWSQGERELIFETKCRHEPNKGSQYVTAADGKQIIFSCIVYMPRPIVLITPAIIPVPNLSQRIYAGETLLYIVPDDIALGQTATTVPGISDNRFTLKQDGRLLKEVDEFVILSNGFNLQGSAGTLIPKQRYELQKYFVFNVNNSGVGGPGVSSDFQLQPGMLFEIWEGEFLRVSDTIKQFSKGQMNMRVWL